MLSVIKAITVTQVSTMGSKYDLIRWTAKIAKQTYMSQQDHCRTLGLGEQ
jgi:hypothetical protein